MSRSGAIHGLMASVLRGRTVAPAARRRAFTAPIEAWRRILGFEGCAPQFDRQLRTQGSMADVPAPLRQLLRESTASALRLGLLAHRQLAEIAAVAERHEVPLLALKGAAQLLGGQVPGARSISDIDLMVRPEDAARFHGLLASELGFSVAGRAYAHHLPVLERPASLNIDLHVRLSDRPVALDTAIWRDVRTVSVDGTRIGIPSPTNMLLHVLEHGLRLNWMGRYRLRDVLDAAALYSAEVCDAAVHAYVAASDDRAACETLLSAAHELEPRSPLFRHNAWRTIHRVARMRLAFASIPRDRYVAERLFRYVGLVAEGSPRSLIRAGRSAMARLAGAVQRTAASL